MEKDIKITIEKPKKGKGGFRPGAGRKDGSKNILTVRQLLDKLSEIEDGLGYEDLLIEDFIKARDSGDKNLAYKYHQLILNKVMNSLQRVEILDNGEQVKAKEEAFTKALQRLISTKEE